MASKLLRLSSVLRNCSNKSTFVKCQHASTAASVNYKQALANLPATQLTTLDNGMRIASEDTGVPTATVGLWVDTGSRYENEKNNGVAHFFEHIAFKSTSKRSQNVLEQEIESMGAYMKASTSREQSAFYAKCLASDVPKIIEILADIIQNAKLSETEIEQERAVIIREMQDLETDLQKVVMDHLHSIAFQGTPLGRTVHGPTKNIKSISKSNLQEYANTHFKSPRMVLAGAGGVNHSDLVKLANQHFSKVKAAYDNVEIPVLSPCRFTGSEIRVRDDSMPLAHIAIAVEGCGWSDPDYLPLLIASNIIGSWDKTQANGAVHPSVLAQAATQANIAHSFQSFHTCYRDTGLWGIYWSCEKLSCEDMLFNVQSQWMYLCTTVTEGDVARARNIVKTSLLRQVDGSTKTCKNIGQQILNYGRRMPLHELEASIENITAQQIRDVCNKYIYDKCPAVAAVGPTENLPDYNRIRSSMYWLRV